MEIILFISFLMCKDFKIKMDLPLELNEKILGLLAPRELINLNLVNKKWYAIVNLAIKNLKTDKLIISDIWTFKENWFPSYEPINYDDLIKIDSFDYFKLNREHVFSKITLLCIHSTKQQEEDESEFKLVDLVNRLTKLENLKILGLNLKNQKDECINLKSLKTLDVDRFKCNNIIMNTPNLENFRIIDSWICKFTFKYPKSIKRLFVDHIFGNCIENFSNLEYFYINHVYHLRTSILQELPLLKELHFESSLNWDCYETVLQSMNENKTDCKPFMFGVNFEDLDEDHCIDDLYSINKSNIDFFKQYPTKIADKLRFINLLFYNDLERMFDKIPLELIEKLVSLKKVEIKGTINNADQLIEVLRRLSQRIMILDISYASLGQSFYDRLPNMIRILDQLSITSENLNFNFLLKFKDIRGFQTDQNLKTEIIDSFISKYHESFKYLNYKEIFNPIRITRTSKGRLRTDKLIIKNYDDNHLNSYDVEMGLDTLFDA